MEFQEKEAIISRIQSGLIGFSVNKQKYICKEPSTTVKYYCNILYNEVISDIDAATLPSLSELQNILINKKLWSKELENELDVCTNNIDQLKVAIYESRFKSRDRKEAKRAIDITKKRQSELLNQKHYYDYLSYEYVCNLYKQYYLFYYSLCDAYGNFLHSKYDEEDFILGNIDILLNKYYKTLLVESQYRELARTDPWATIWNCADKEHSLFGIAPINYNIEQRMLVSWTSHYTNIYQRSDAPPQSVIDDDDALDGWFIVIKRKKESEDNTNAFQDVLDHPSLANAGEVYIPAQTEEDAKMIDNLNDPVAKMIKKQRQAVLEKLGTVDEMEMPDTKQRLFNSMNEQFINTVKG